LGLGFIASWDDDDDDGDSSQALKPPQIALAGIRVLGFNRLTNHVQHILQEEDEENLMVNTSL
jgi:hypothetical protein